MHSGQIRMAEIRALNKGVARFKLLMIGASLGAVAIGPVPVQWIATAAIFVVYVMAMPHVLDARVVGRNLFITYVGWAIFVGLISAISTPSYHMPKEATTPYIAYVLLRYVNLVAFLAILLFTSWLLSRGYRAALMRWLATLGGVIAAIAIYIYWAQLHGWPDIPRTRLGTGGDAQATVFTYAFHRAMGTFREPAHLAEWLVVPFFLSLLVGRSLLNLRSVLITVAMLLTGSLTGLVAIFIGAIAAWGLLFARATGRVMARFKFPKRSVFLLVLPAEAALLLLIAIAGFYWFAQSYSGYGIHLWTVLIDRILPIATGGLEASNRGYILEYIRHADIPLMGEGLGNANLILNKYLHLDAVPGFLSVYANALFAVGPIGLLLLCGFLVRPFFSTQWRTLPIRQSWALLAGYIGWLVMMSVGGEELSLMFAISFALLTATDRLGPEVTSSDAARKQRGTGQGMYDSTANA